MFYKLLSRKLPQLMLTAALALSGCAPFFEIATTSGTAPTPVVVVEQGGVDNPDVFVDPAVLKGALLEALNARDVDRLQRWMTVNVLTGTWRADLSETSPGDAAAELESQLPDSGEITPVEGADIMALLGGKDPLSIPREEALVVETVLVSGWGKDGCNEALLFISRGIDDSVKWHGWMTIKGGFSGARSGGLQPYADEMLGYSLFVPKDYEINAQSPSNVVFIAPGEGHSRGIAFLTVEPANGRTTEQVIEGVMTELGGGFNVNRTALSIEDAEAFVLSGLPGQDSNRQLFVVHGDLLYHFHFSPDDPQAGEAYQQMLDVYAMVVNTLHFTK